MNSFLKSIGLCESCRIEVDINRSELIQRLWKITYKTNTTFISLEKDSAIPTRFEYRGMIKENSFIIKRRTRLFDINMNNSVFHGHISDENGKSSISVEVRPSEFQIFNRIVILCFCLVVVFANIEEDKQDFMFVAIASIIAFSQYFILKRGVSRGKYEFERELVYIVQKP
ncbi:hypothetical protein [Chryseobacterium tongliaoense]|uniref:hypothetical protein n=1 Tax=Chryseobacterium tongliaoense TaxID=3240933 RepID=UPI003515E4A6